MFLSPQFNFVSKHSFLLVQRFNSDFKKSIFTFFPSLTALVIVTEVPRMFEKVAWTKSMSSYVRLR